MCNRIERLMCQTLEKLHSSFTYKKIVRVLLRLDTYHLHFTMKFFLLFLVQFLSFHATPTLAKPIRLFREDILMTHKPTISNLVPSPLAILAEVSIGEPSVPKLLYMDTGSSFTWIKRESQLPLYDPTTSSTIIIPVGCDGPGFTSAPIIIPNYRTGGYRYIQTYFDGSESTGRLATEKFQFGLHSVSDVEFGCESNVTNGFEGGSGLLGLSYTKYSILKHFSNRFSFCFGTLNADPYSSQGFLAFGDEARTTGKATPLIMLYGHYHVDLEAIYVNGKVIPKHSLPIRRREIYVNGRVVPGAHMKGNTIIDTGTSILYLAGESYTELESHISRLVNGHLNSFSHDGLVCYNGTIQREMSTLPTVTLAFVKGASLELDPTTLFHQYDDEYFCLAVMMTPDDIHLNFIGTTALQNYNIGFDLDNETIYFDKISCKI